MEVVVVNIMHVVKIFVDKKLQEYVKDPEAFLTESQEKFKAFVDGSILGADCGTVFGHEME